MSQSPSASSNPAVTPASGDVRLVIVDYTHDQVRLARLDATDTAAVTGQLDGVVAGQVIVLNGRSLLAVPRVGTVKTLGQLAGAPEWIGPGTVAVNPSISQWIYTLTDSSWRSQIHLGTPGSDRVVATLPSPDGYDFYAAFAWNASGVYMIKQATGLGGAGPFLEYHMPLARLDLTSGSVAMVSPQCVAEQVLDDGTMLCRNTNPGGSVEVRSPSGSTHNIQLSTGTTASNGVFTRLTLSPDSRHVVVARNGSHDPVINYQMAVANLSSTGASAFGPIDYVPDVWLPDGRVVAEHVCVPADFGGGACDQSVDGTYFVSADGKNSTLFFKLAQASYVVAYV